MNPIMNRLDIVVSDQKASIEFYQHLGLEFETPSHHPGHAYCDLPGGLHLMLDQENVTVVVRDGWTRAAGSPPIFLAFQLGTPKEVDAKFDELATSGYRGSRAPFDAPWGYRFATVLDPDGNGVDLYCPLEDFR